jgi:hypothetical protein
VNVGSRCCRHAASEYAAQPPHRAPPSPEVPSRRPRPPPAMHRTKTKQGAVRNSAPLEEREIVGSIPDIGLQVAYLSKLHGPIRQVCHQFADQHPSCCTKLRTKCEHCVVHSPLQVSKTAPRSWSERGAGVISTQDVSKKPRSRELNSAHSLVPINPPAQSGFFASLLPPFSSASRRLRYS